MPQKDINIAQDIIKGEMKLYKKEKISPGSIMKQTKMWTSCEHSVECKNRSKFGLGYL